MAMHSELPSQPFQRLSGDEGPYREKWVGERARKRVTEWANEKKLRLQIKSGSCKAVKYLQERKIINKLVEASVLWVAFSLKKNQTCRKYPELTQSLRKTVYSNHANNIVKIDKSIKKSARFKRKFFLVWAIWKSIIWTLFQMKTTCSVHLVMSKALYFSQWRFSNKPDYMLNLGTLFV